MESTVSKQNQFGECQFLAKPSIKAKDLPYVRGKKEIYVNLFKVSVLKDWVVYQYPISFTPEVSNENQRMKRALFSKVDAEVREDFGEYFLSGEILYAFKDVRDLKQYSLKDTRDNIEYVLKILPSKEGISLNDNNPLQTPLIKQIYELFIKEILRANPNLEFYRNLFVKTDQKKEVSSNKTKVDFFPGFATSLMYTPNGPFLNISIKNKILSTDSCLDILLSLRKAKGKYTKSEEDDIKEYFIRRSIKTTYNRRNYIVDDISFDKTPKNTSLNREGKNITLINYYKVAHGITIKNTDQPLLISYARGVDGSQVALYFVPELCILAGIDDSVTKDFKFMQNLANYTKLTPKERVTRTNDFLALLEDKKGKTVVNKDTKVKKTLPSSYEKKNLYGVQIAPAEKNSFNALYMDIPALVGSKNSKFSTEERKPVPVAVSKDLNSWLVVYHKDTEKIEEVVGSMKQASRAYGISVKEPEWLEMSSVKASDWTAEVEEFLKTKRVSVVVFILDNYIDRLYKDLKIHSYCTLGYISQCVKVESLRKNAMSVCSKLLLQINAKLGGCTYKVDFGSEVKKMNLMVIGVDSSHISGKRTGVAMVASTNSDFTEICHKIDIIEEKNKETLVYCVSSFLREAVGKFFAKNKKLPSGIVIYRQGVSAGQKTFLKSEVALIEQFLNGYDDDKLLKGNPIPYYYILVNTKTTYKFFEKESQRNKLEFYNPQPGLLVMDDITDPKNYEFYIQPQDVTQGTATPTCYHVAFGNLDYPAVIPKLTFDLCYLYPNWVGPVRVPGHLKAAEKLSKMTAKYTKAEVSSKLKDSQMYL